MDIVEKLTRIADACQYTDGTDTPLGAQAREGAAEITRLRTENERLKAEDRIISSVRNSYM